MWTTPDQLVSDRERARVGSALQKHYETGRLTLDEFEQRLDELHAARTNADLENVLRQLPARRAAGPARTRSRRRVALAPYILINLVCILVWAFGGAGDFWPKWVLVGTLIMFLRRAYGFRARGPLPPSPPPPPELPR